MLSPDVPDTLDKLTAAYGGIVSVDSFALTCHSIRVIPLLDEPAWLPPVKTEFQELNTAADAWQRARPSIWAPILVAFQSFFATFSGVSTLDPSQGDAQFWIKILQGTLLPGAEKNLAATTAAELALNTRLGDFSSVLPAMDASIAAGWAAVADEEETMLQLTEKLGELNESVQVLGSKLTSDAISADKEFAQTAVSLLYDAAEAGTEASVPIIGLVFAVFTVGKSFYDLIEDDKELIATMNRVNGIKAELSGKALGLALTKSTLQTLYSVEKQYLALRDAISALIDLWKTQQSKVQDAINALQAGARPDQYFDLLTIPVALANWKAIGDFVGQLSGVDVKVGEPVTIDISKAEIRPTLTGASQP